MNFISELVRFSNERIANHNTKVDSPRRWVRPITDKELRMVLAILIIGKQEKGTMEFRMWFKNRLLSRINMFSEIGGFPSYNVNFISCTRFYQILRFLSPGAIQYVPRQAWKKSSASNYQPFGGYFVNLNGRVLDLNLLFDRYVTDFNNNSRSVYNCSGTITLDEILSKSKSRKNPLKQYNASKRDRIGVLWHTLMDANSSFCVKVRIKFPKQFTQHHLFKTEGLVLDFLDDFRGSYARVCQDNFFNSYSLTSKLNQIGLYVHGTCRKQIISRHFADHPDGLNGFIDAKHKQNHRVRCFTHDDEVDGQMNVMIYNSPGRNSVIFLTNSNDVLGRSTETSTDEDNYRTYFGGNYTRDLPTINSRPHLTKIYNSEMNSCDVYDQYLHAHSIRYVPMKHKLSWILKPTLSILDYEFLNSFFIQRESNENGQSSYRTFLLKLAQGLVADCVRDENEALDGQGNSSRNMCAECKVLGKRDSRTRIHCIKCKSPCCKAHSDNICKQCV